jgi:hypothetical protein
LIAAYETELGNISGDERVGFEYMPYHLTGDAIPATEGAECWREAIQALSE